MTLAFGHASAVDQPWHGPFSSRDEATQHARSRYGRARGFYIVVGEAVQLVSFLPDGRRLADSVLSEIWSAAYEKYGDHADVIPDTDDLSTAATSELREVLVRWARTHLQGGWMPTGKPIWVEPLTQLALVPRTEPAQPTPVDPYRTDVSYADPTAK